MPANTQPALVGEALKDMAPVDAGGAVAALVADNLPLLKRQARVRGDVVVNRGTIALTISGGDEASRKLLADSYAKALHGYEITLGREESPDPWIRHADWSKMIANDSGAALARNKAIDAFYSEKSEAENGTLIIDNVFEPAEAFESAKHGVFEQFFQVLEERADKDYTPVLILTGEKDKLDAFFAKNHHLSRFFTNVEALPTPKPPAPEVSVTLDNTVSAVRRFRLKPGP
jgi:pimeloyl-ACP methyl ester carboxylesterase